MPFGKKVKNFFALEKNIIVITIANLFWATVILYKDFLPKFYESLGASVFFVGLLFSLGNLFYVIASFWGGHLSDKHGRKYIFARTTLIGNFLLLGYIFAPNWIFLIPFIMFGNILGGLGDASAQTLISESAPKKRRATALASIYAMASLFGAVLIPIGALFIQNYGMLGGVRISVLISLIFSLIGTFILFFYGKETFKKSKQNKIDFSIYELKKFFKKLPFNVKGIFLFISLLYFSSALLTPLWIFYSLDVIKISSFEFGILSSIQFIVVAFFQFTGAKLSDKYGRKKIFLISVLACCVFEILFILSTNFMQLVFVYLIGGIGAMGFSTIFAYVADNIDQKRRSKAIGITNGLMTLVSIPAPFIGSLFYTVAPQYPFIFSSLLLIITFIVGMKFLK